MFKIKTLRIIFCVLMTGVALGCAGRKAGWEQEISAIQGDARALIEEADKYWENRLNRADLDRAIALYLEAAQRDPENVELFTRLSLAYYFLAEAHSGNDKDAQLAAYNEGAQWGERALGIHPEFRRLVEEEGVKPEDAFYVLDKRYIGALYWSASNLGKWAKKKGIIAALSLRSRGIRAMERCLELDETYFYGAPHRWLGTYYAVIPAFAGGDLEKSQYHFERSLAIEPNYFATRVLRAENYAPKVNDRQLFESDLHYVLNTDPEVLPDIVPEQKVEQEKAKKLLAEIDDLFF